MVSKVCVDQSDEHMTYHCVELYGILAIALCLWLTNILLSDFKYEATWLFPSFCTVTLLFFYLAMNLSFFVSSTKATSLSNCASVKAAQPMDASDGDPCRKKTENRSQSSNSGLPAITKIFPFESQVWTSVAIWNAKNEMHSDINRKCVDSFYDHLQSDNDYWFNSDPGISITDLWRKKRSK